MILVICIRAMPRSLHPSSVVAHQCDFWKSAASFCHGPHSRVSCLAYSKVAFPMLRASGEVIR